MPDTDEPEATFDPALPDVRNGTGADASDLTGRLVEWRGGVTGPADSLSYDSFSLADSGYQMNLHRRQSGTA